MPVTPRPRPMPARAQPPAAPFSLPRRGSGSFHLLRPQPARRLHKLHQVGIDERQDGLAEGVADKLILALAVGGARPRQQSLVREALDRVGRAAIAQTEIIVEALASGAVLVGEPRPLPLLVLRQKRPGGALDGEHREVAAELQHDETGNLIGGVLLAAV